MMLQYINNRLVRLAGCQPASSIFLSHQFSTSHQPPVSQYIFLSQQISTGQPNEANANIREVEATVNCNAVGSPRNN
jgi:hypothetical protein